MRYTILFSVLATVCSACIFEMGKPVKGDGNVVTKTRQPGQFSRIQQKGSLDIEIVQGASHEVKIIAEDNIAEHIETEMEGGALVIRTEEGFRLKPTRDIQIVVTAPSLNGVESFGSGDIKSTTEISSTSQFNVDTRGSGNITLQVKAPEVEAESTGSGNIELSGSCTRLRLSTTGSGNLTADELSADEVVVDIRGSGNGRVFANKSLTVDVKGSGDVSYRGNPSIKTDIKGSGSVNKID